MLPSKSATNTKKLMLRKYKTLTKSSPEKQNSGSGSGSGLISLCNQDIHVKSQSIRTPALD
jgi:hypothetical protein